MLSKACFFPTNPPFIYENKISLHVNVQAVGRAGPHLFGHTVFRKEMINGFIFIAEETRIVFHSPPFPQVLSG
jgi:hypothetical protein